MTAPIPATIGRYQVRSVLGRGAMGVVLRADDPAIDRPVAIKLVRADLLEGDDRIDYIARFQREAQAAGRCSHPGIVAVYDYALHEGNPYLAMEFIDGATLLQVRGRAGGMTPAAVVSIGRQMLDALGAAHALGVIHRDIKPANVMLTAAGRVKLTDFGISRLDSASLTGTGAVVGTPSYMAPEQCRGGPTDARADLFSTAVVLYELLTETKPFPGASQHEVWQNLLFTEPVDAALLRPDAPAGLLAAIRRGLVKQPGERVADAAAMAALLDGREEGAAGTARDDAPSLFSDRTVLLPSAEAPSSTLGLDSAALTTIERGLARHVGPIAALLVRSAVRKADSVTSLCDALVSNIEDAGGRDHFRREMEVQVAASLTRSKAGSAVDGRTALSAADLDQAQAELARFVGPIARVLVKQAAPGCADLAQLWQRIAEHVEPGERATFERRMPSGR